LHPVDERLTRPGGLAQRLWQMRKAAGLTGDQMAADLGWARSKISKIENGRQIPEADDISAWATECGHPEVTPELLDLLDDIQTIRRQARTRLRRGHAALQGDIDQRTRASRRIRDAQPMAIPGLLQTAGYAQAIAVQVAAVYGTTDVSAAVEARMRRQEILYDSAKVFEFIIAESALRMLPCSPQVMLGQLDRLLALLDLDNVTLAIIPMGVELSFAPFYGFLMLDDVVIMEDYLGENENSAEGAVLCDRIFSLLMTDAVTGEDARRLIMAAAARLRQG
jgi:transcriptional regulator with XRE-family HTH domain